MKKLSSKMKILLVMAVCVAMVVPAVVSADPIRELPWEDQKIGPGEVILDFQMWGQSPDEIEFDIDNGKSTGENRVSSVTIALLDEKGKVKEVIISPNKFNQDVGNAKATFSMEGLSNPSFLIRVRGKKSNYIVLTVDEYLPPSDPVDNHNNW